MGNLGIPWLTEGLAGVLHYLGLRLLLSILLAATVMLQLCRLCTAWHLMAHSTSAAAFLWLVLLCAADFGCGKRISANRSGRNSQHRMGDYGRVALSHLQEAGECLLVKLVLKAASLLLKRCQRACTPRVLSQKHPYLHDRDINQI